MNSMPFQRWHQKPPLHATNSSPEPSVPVLSFKYLSCPLKSSSKILFHSAQLEHCLLSKAFLNLSSIFPMHLIYSFIIINPLSYNYHIYLPK